MIYLFIYLFMYLFIHHIFKINLNAAAAVHCLGICYFLFMFKLPIFNPSPYSHSIATIFQIQYSTKYSTYAFIFFEVFLDISRYLYTSNLQ